MVAAWLLHPDRSSFSLEKLTEAKLLIETISFDSIVPKGKNFTDVPLETAVKYGAEDADFTWQLWQIFEKELKENNLFSLFTDLEMPILPILAQMEMEGIHIEKSELAEYSKDLTSQIEKLQSEIYEIVGHEFNIASPKQLQEVLFTERGLKTGKKTKTGYSTNTDVLEELANQDPVPAKILEFRKLSKLLSTYVDTLPTLADKNGRIHTTFIQTGTATGRLSSRDPNLQNIPVRDENGRKIRKAFDAEKGKVLISADYSQIELVILAHLSKDKNLCQAFLTGNDVHKATASLIFGVSPEEVKPEMRRTAKTINFGVIYGMSAFRLAGELGISRTIAKNFIDSYFATYSGVQDFINSTIEQAEKEGFVETISGRRRYIKAINSANKTEKAAAERIAINTPIQGSAADIVKKAMIKVDSELKQKFPEAKLLLQVHDELIAECPENQAEQVAELIKTTMESIIALDVPLKASVEIGKRWGEFH
jgi:DNA polymerase-1